jgi:hypothetical protein
MIQKKQPPTPAQPSRSRIDVQESWQCKWWSDHFGVTRSQLLAAILKVGVDAEAVRRELRR